MKSFLVHFPATFKIGRPKSTSPPTTKQSRIQVTNSSHRQQWATPSSIWVPSASTTLYPRSRNMIKGLKQYLINNQIQGRQKVRSLVFRSKWAPRDSWYSNRRSCGSKTPTRKQLRVPDRPMRWGALTDWIGPNRLRVKRGRLRDQARISQRLAGASLRWLATRGLPRGTWWE